MKVFKGKIVGGRIELPPGAGPEGAEVTVLVSEGESTFELSPDDVRELLMSIDQASRGEIIDGRLLLAELSD